MLAEAHRGPGRPQRPLQGGFTLVEILVVMAIIALMMGSAVRGFRSLAKSDLRGAAAHMSGAIRYLFDRASTTGKMHRLVIDLNEERYWAEVSDDKFFIPRETETPEQVRQREEQEAQEDEEKRLKQEKAAAESASSYASGSSASGSSFDLDKLEMGVFRVKRARFGAFKEMALTPIQLKNALVRSVYTPRLSEPVTSGRAYIYFFPLGQTEPAIVTLSDKGGEAFYSMVVHPITGRVKLYDQEMKPPLETERPDDEGNRVARP